MSEHTLPPRPLGARLALLRRHAQLSQRELSRLAGVAATYVRQCEEGARRGPCVEHVARLALALGASLDWLVLGRGTPPTRRAMRLALARAEQGATRAERARARAEREAQGLGPRRRGRPRRSPQPTAFAAIGAEGGTP
jgi:transcriptional regulator with XRE-family HTH domain